MEMDKRGNLFTGGDDGPSVPRMWINAAIRWERESGPDPLSGESFNECHGGPVDGSPIQWDGALWITPTGDSLEILWHFDHYWERVPKFENRPDGPTLNLIENFTLRGEASDPDGDGTYKGSFTIGLHGEPPFGSVDLEFTFGILPVEP